MFLTFVRATLVLLGASLTAHAATHPCLPLLEAHLETTDTVPGEYVPGLLQRRPRAVLVAHFVFIKKGFPPPTEDGFDVFKAGDMEFVGVRAGTREQLLELAARLTKQYGGAVGFQILGGTPTGVFDLRPATAQLLVNDDLKPLERALAAPSFDGLALHGAGTRVVSQAMPASALRLLDDQALTALGLAIDEGGAAAWAGARTAKNASPTVFRGAGYVIANAAAFIRLTRLAGYAAGAPAVSPELDSLLPTCADEPCVLVEPLPSLATWAEVFAYLKSEFPDVDPRGPGSLATYLERLYARHLPGDAVDVSQVKKMDGHLLSVNDKWPNEGAQKRLMNAWSTLSAKVHARPALPAVATAAKMADATPAAPKRSRGRPRKVAPPAAPAVSAAPVAATEVPAPRAPVIYLTPGPEVAPKARPLYRTAERAAPAPPMIDKETARLMLGVLERHRKLIGLSQPDGVRRAMLDLLYKYKKQIGPSYESFRGEIQNLPLPKTAYTAIREGKSLAPFVTGWEILRRAVRDPAAGQPLNPNSIRATDAHLDALSGGGGIKFTTVVGSRQIELPGQPLPLMIADGVLEDFRKMRLSDDDVRVMIMRWNKLREKGVPNKPDQDFTVLMPPESNRGAWRDGGIVAELNERTITKVYRDQDVEFDFYGRMTTSQALQEETLAVKFAAERRLRRVKVPAELVAQLSLSGLHLHRVEDILARYPRRPVDGPAGTCFELREKDGDAGYFACFADFGSPDVSTLLQFRPAGTGRLAH